ncbi:MAG: DoxX family protein [Reichenbachiella sp.]
MNKNKITYWVATGLLSLMMTMSIGMYLFNNAEIRVAFTSLGFPIWIIYPLAAAKTLAIIAIISKKSVLLKEWAYAGLIFNTLLAMSAHLSVSDGEFMGAAIALVLVIVSRIMDGKLSKTS